MWRPVCFSKLHWGQSKAVRTGLCQTCLAASFAGEKVCRFLQRATGKGTAKSRCYSRPGGAVCHRDILFVASLEQEEKEEESKKRKWKGRGRKIRKRKKVKGKKKKNRLFNFLEIVIDNLYLLYYY
jgi:hypothetical protein